MERVLGERLVQRAAALDVGLDVEDELLHGLVLVAVADDLEGLNERDTGGHHRRELTREDGDVARRDLLGVREKL